MNHSISTPDSSSPPAPAPLPDAAAAGAATSSTGRRWYTHRLNTALSLRLILGIIPRVPRFLVPPIGVVTTAICIIFMRRERQAAARNLARVLGVRGWRLRRAVWLQFYAFSRFMVSHCALVSDPDPEALRRWTEDDAGGQARVRAALEGGRGLIAATAHLGNWEAGMRLLGLVGAPVNVVMRPDRESAAERWLMERRAGTNMRVVRPDGGPASTLALRAALQRNEIVAMQADRLIGGRSLTVDLFGAPFGLPSGPFLLAYVCDAPLLPVFVVQDGWWRWHAEVGEPVRFPRTADRDADLRAGAGQYAAALERAVREHPDQWFNFYDLWPTQVEA